MTHLFPDNSVIINFVMIDRLDLLRAFLRDRARVTQAVSQEINDSVSKVAGLNKLDQEEWFGKPIRLTRQKQQIEGIRRFVFGGRVDQPKKHLGESETLYLIQHDKDFVGSIWITEDRSAYDYARANTIPARNTFEVFCELCADGALTADEAFEYLEYLYEEARLFYCPESAGEIG